MLYCGNLKVAKVAGMLFSDLRRLRTSVLQKKPNKSKAGLKSKKAEKLSC